MHTEEQRCCQSMQCLCMKQKKVPLCPDGVLWAGARLGKWKEDGFSCPLVPWVWYPCAGQNLHTQVAALNVIHAMTKSQEHVWCVSVYVSLHAWRSWWGRFVLARRGEEEERGKGWLERPHERECITPWSMCGTFSKWKGKNTGIPER